MQISNLAKPLALTTAALLLVGAIALALGLRLHSEAPVDPSWAVTGTLDIPENALTVRFTGTSTLLFSDSQTAWMIDGWFTRPPALQLALGKIEPDLEAITQGLAANQVETLAAVIPMHSHYDHAMDAPEVARRTGAILMGSEATANIGRGWGLAEAQIQVLQDRVPVHIGEFVVTPIASRHFQFPNARTRELALGSPEIDAPLVPPVKAFDYRLGKAWVLHIQHPLGSFVVVGSAGYVEGSLAGLQADLIFLGIGGLGGQTPQYREAYWRETVEQVNAGTVIPIHYDSLTGPIEGPFTGSSIVLGLLSGGEENTLPFLQEKEASSPQRKFITLPRYDVVALFTP